MEYRIQNKYSADPFPAPNSKQQNDCTEDNNMTNIDSPVIIKDNRRRSKRREQLCTCLLLLVIVLMIGIIIWLTRWNLLQKDEIESLEETKKILHSNIISLNLHISNLNSQISGLWNTQGTLLNKVNSYHNNPNYSLLPDSANTEVENNQSPPPNIYYFLKLINGVIVQKNMQIEKKNEINKRLLLNNRMAKKTIISLQDQLYSERTINARHYNMLEELNQELALHIRELNNTYISEKYNLNKEIISLQLDKYRVKQIAKGLESILKALLYKLPTINLNHHNRMAKKTIISLQDQLYSERTINTKHYTILEELNQELALHIRELNNTFISEKYYLNKEIISLQIDKYRVKQIAKGLKNMLNALLHKIQAIKENHHRNSNILKNNNNQFTLYIEYLSELNKELLITLHLNKNINVEVIIQEAHIANLEGQLIHLTYQNNWLKQDTTTKIAESNRIIQNYYTCIEKYTILNNQNLVLIDEEYKRDSLLAEIQYKGANQELALGNWKQYTNNQIFNRDLKINKIERSGDYSMPLIKFFSVTIASITGWAINSRGYYYKAISIMGNYQFYKGHYNEVTGLYVIGAYLGYAFVYDMKTLSLFGQYKTGLANSHFMCYWRNNTHFECADTTNKVIYYKLDDANSYASLNYGANSPRVMIILRNGKTVVGDKNSDLSILYGGGSNAQSFTPTSNDVQDLAEVRDNLVIAPQINELYCHDFSNPSSPNSTELASGNNVFYAALALKEGNGWFAFGGRISSRPYVKIAQLSVDGQTMTVDQNKQGLINEGWNVNAIAEPDPGILLLGGRFRSICIWNYKATSPTQEPYCFDKFEGVILNGFIPARYTY